MSHIHHKGRRLRQRGEASELRQFYSRNTLMVHGSRRPLAVVINKRFILRTVAAVVRLMTTRKGRDGVVKITYENNIYRWRD